MNIEKCGIDDFELFDMDWQLGNKILETISTF